MFITDYFTESSSASSYLRYFAELAGITYFPKKDVGLQIESIEAVMNKRINDDKAGLASDNPPIIGTIAFIQNSPDLKKNQFGMPSDLMVKIQNILKDGPYYGIHLIVYAYNYKGLDDVMDNKFIRFFGNRVILQDGFIGYQMPQETESLTEGTALLISEDKSTTYEQDPVMIYNECQSDSLQDDVLDYIFSIYNNK